MGYRTIECRSEEEWLEARKPLANASSFAAIRNHSPWQSALDYWREKHGLISHQAGNVSMARGKEREPVIRAWFAEENPWYRVTYHQYDIYVSDRPCYGMMSCTLDGELEVCTDAVSMLRGEKGILEIKSVGILSRRDIWEKPPVYYMDQIYGQLFIRDDCSFAVLVAEFHYEGSEEFQGDIPEYSRKRWIIYRSQSAAEIQGVADDVALWWRAYMEEDRMPPAVIQGGTGESHDLVVITADAVIGSFEENFEAVKKQIEDMVAPYEGYEVTEGNLKDAKALHAELSKMEKEIDQKRIAVKKKYMEPCDAFEVKANELKALITEKRTPIKSQIDGFEERRVEEKKALIEGLWHDAAVRKLNDDMAGIFLGSAFCSCEKGWLNKGTTKKEISAAMEERVDEFMRGMDAIDIASGGNESLASVMGAEFLRTAKLDSAIAAKERYEASVAMASRKAAEAPKAPAPAPEPDAEPIPLDGDSIAYRFVASHRDAKEWLALIGYMKEHGFTIIESTRI